MKLSKRCRLVKRRIEELEPRLKRYDNLDEMPESLIDEARNWEEKMEELP